MKNDPDPIHDDLSAFLDGQLPPGKAQRLADRLEHEPELRRELAELEATRKLVGQLPPAKAPEGLYDAVMAEVERRQLLDEQGHGQVRRRRRWPRHLATAALVLLGVALGVYLYGILPGDSWVNGRRDLNGSAGHELARTHAEELREKSGKSLEREAIGDKPSWISEAGGGADIETTAESPATTSEVDVDYEALVAMDLGGQSLVLPRTQVVLNTRDIQKTTAKIERVMAANFTVPVDPASPIAQLAKNTPTLATYGRSASAKALPADQSAAKQMFFFVDARQAPEVVSQLQQINGDVVATGGLTGPTETAMGPMVVPRGLSRSSDREGSVPGTRKAARTAAAEPRDGEAIRLDTQPGTMADEIETARSDESLPAAAAPKVDKATAAATRPASNGGAIASEQSSTAKADVIAESSETADQRDRLSPNGREATEEMFLSLRDNRRAQHSRPFDARLAARQDGELTVEEEDLDHFGVLSLQRRQEQDRMALPSRDRRVKREDSAVSARIAFSAPVVEDEPSPAESVELPPPPASGPSALTGRDVEEIAAREEPVDLGVALQSKPTDAEHPTSAGAAESRPGTIPASRPANDDGETRITLLGAGEEDMQSIATQPVRVLAPSGKLGGPGPAMTQPEGDRPAANGELLPPGDSATPAREKTVERVDFVLVEVLVNEAPSTEPAPSPAGQPKAGPKQDEP